MSYLKETNDRISKLFKFKNTFTHTFISYFEIIF